MPLVGYNPPASVSGRHKAFCSLRFDGIVNRAAEELQAKMLTHGVYLNIVNMVGGDDIDDAVQMGILDCDNFIVFGSAHYGENTGNSACTYYESKFAHSQKKRIILIRMIPFDQEFQFPQAKFMFGLNRLELPWMLGTQMPSELPAQLFDAMELRASPQATSEPAPEPRPSQTRPGAINNPGHWDAMISYTQRNANAKLLAAELYASLGLETGQGGVARRQDGQAQRGGDEGGGDELALHRRRDLWRGAGRRP